jgi:hypothetical protein
MLFLDRILHSNREPNMPTVVADAMSAPLNF